MLAQTSAALADVDKLIKTLLIAARVLHVDETSTQVAGKRYWLHVACTPWLTAYHLHPSRGRVAVALCGAHISRVLAAADEAHPGQLWPIQARDASLALNIAAHRARAAGQEHIPPEIAQFYLTLLAIERLADLARARRARADVSR